MVNHHESSSKRQETKRITDSDDIVSLPADRLIVANLSRERLSCILMGQSGLAGSTLLRASHKSHRLNLMLLRTLKVGFGISACFLYCLGFTRLIEFRQTNAKTIAYARTAPIVRL